MRDAQGNTMAVYNNVHGTTDWMEQHLYGSSRIGMWNPRVTLTNNNALAVWDTAGHKQYELNNHLGNVLATISDKRTFDGTYYNADVLTANDYYPFGMVQPGRQYAKGDVYRYGFNGKKNDIDVKGTGNQQDYGMRIYDPRVARFLSVDPISKEYPWYTPYQFAGNTPIQAIDLDGAEEYHFTLTYNEKTGVSVLKPTSVKQLESGNIFGRKYPGGQWKQVLVEYNKEQYHIGFGAGDDALTVKVFFLWKQHPNAKMFEKLFPSDDDRPSEGFAAKRFQENFVQHLLSIVPLGFTNFQPVNYRMGSLVLSRSTKK